MNFGHFRGFKNRVVNYRVPFLVVVFWLGMVSYLNRLAFYNLLRLPGGPLTPSGCARFLRESIRIELPPLLIVLMVGAGSWGLGLNVLQAAGIRTRRGLDHVTAFALGVGFLASSLFAVGLAQIYYASVIGGCAALLLGWGLVTLYRHSSELRTIAFRPFENPFWAVFGGTVTLYALWHGFVLALAPILPSDATVYHLCLPKLYLEAHGVYAIPWNIFSHWPHLMEMLFGLPISLGVDRGAPLIHWLMCAALAVAVFLVGRRETDERVAWIATMLLVSQRAFLNISGAAYIDGAFGLFAFLSMYALWNGIRDKSPSWMVVGGILGGMAVASKLLGAVTLALSLVWILWSAPQGGKTRNVLLFIIPAMLLVGPWFLKTWVTTGNPVWPYFPQVFGDRHGAVKIAESMSKTFQPEYTPLELWRSQLSTVSISPNWTGDVFRPFFFLTLLAFLFRSSWPPIMGYWFWPILPYLAMLHPEADFRRYLAPLWGHIFLWNAWVLGEISRRSKILSLLVIPVVVSMLVPIWQTTEGNALLALSQWRPLYGMARTAEEFYFNQEAPYVLTLKKIDALLGPDDKVFLIHEIYAYYLTHRYEFAFLPGIQPIEAFRETENAESLARVLRSQGFTYALIRDYPEFYLRLFSDKHYQDIVSGLAKRYGKEILSEEHRHLYKLDFSSLQG